MNEQEHFVQGIFVRLKRRGEHPHGRATIMPIRAMYEPYSDTYVAELTDEQVKDLLDPNVRLIDEPPDYLASG